MSISYLIRRGTKDVFPFLEAIRTQADSERTALGFLPLPAYAEAAQQRKIFLLLASEEGRLSYAGHLLFGGMLPTLRVVQMVISSEHRRRGLATMLLRALIAHGEKENYYSIVAKVASDLTAANSFYECNGFATSHLKRGGQSRNRIINVRAHQLATPSLLSLMAAPPATKIDIQPRKRSSETPIYAIDLNVLFDAIKTSRSRSELAGSLIEAAFRHQIRIAKSQEFETELRRTSYDPKDDPILSLAQRIPTLPKQEKGILDALASSIATIVFPERAKNGSLSKTDKSDVMHLSSAIAGGVAGYITSDEKILSAREDLMSEFGLDVIGLAEFVALLDDQPAEYDGPTQKQSRHYRIESSTTGVVTAVLEREGINTESFLPASDLARCQLLSVSDSDGIIGVSALKTSAALEEPTRGIVCVQQQHPFSSTVADYLISHQVRSCTSDNPCHLLLFDAPVHPITRRVAISQGFQPSKSMPLALSKLALGQPVLRETWAKARLAIERIGGLKIQSTCPNFDGKKVKIKTNSLEHGVSLFDLETLVSPALFILPHRAAVVVPITRAYAADLLGTDNQFSFLDIPEAQFLTRRTYFNTPRAARAMIRGAALAFYESSGRGAGRGAIIAIARIVDVTSTPTDAAAEQLQRQGVVDDLRGLTKQPRVLATTFDSLIPLRRPVPFGELRKIGCVDGANFVSAKPISWLHLAEIVKVGFPNERA